MNKSINFYFDDNSISLDKLLDIYYKEEIDSNE